MSFNEISGVSSEVVCIIDLDSFKPNYVYDVI